MRVALVASLLIVTMLVGCTEERAPEPDPTTTTTTTSSAPTTTTTTTTSMPAPPESTCDTWLKTHFASRKEAQPPFPSGARWRLTIDAEGASVNEVTIIGKIEKIVDGEPDPEFGELDVEELTRPNGEVTVEYTPPTGVGRFRFTLLDIQQENADGDCDYKPELNQDEVAKEVGVF